MIVARVRGRLLQARDPAFARIYALRFDPYDSPDLKPAPIFDPAPHGAPERTLIATDDPEHRPIKERFARIPLLGNLHRHTTYDWCHGEIRAGDPVDYVQVFENLLNGYPPGVDHAIAKVMAALDRDEQTRKLAFWFGHTYADLNSRAFAEVTMYDAWYSGRIVDVPDVDAIPFGHEVLRRRSLRTPLSGKPRDRLYEAIQRDALVYRKYRTLREAAAAAFVCAEPTMDNVYARLVPRFHYLYALHGDDLEAIHALLTQSDRDEMIETVDAAIEEYDSDAWKLRVTRKKEIELMQNRVRDFALTELDRISRR